MSLKKKIYRSIAIAAFLCSFASTASAQDLLARQAPVDRSMKTIDTIAVRVLTDRENMENPSGDLYNTWDNHYAHKSSPLPETYRIDLRSFCMPTPSRVITSNFGYRWGRMHKGLDIKVYIGDTIRAAFSGRVRIVRYEGGGYGNYVVIRHNNGLETIYGHLSKQLVKENQVVHAGEPIGLGGNTGRSTGSHLHFETRLCGVALNPALMFDFRDQDVTGDYYVFNRNSYEQESRVATAMRGKGSLGRNNVSGGKEIAESEASNAEMAYDKVANGENLEQFAKKHGVTVETICRLNRMKATSRVHPGQILRIS